MARAPGPNIGAAGEQKVDGWARRDGLRCCKPDPDVIGVDRFVEVFNTSAEGETLDLAERPTLAWLQIKTTNSRVLSRPVKLDICARFVQADAPTFFLLIHMGPDETVEDAYLLHVDEVFGTEVLRTLRKLDPVVERGRLHRHELRVRWNAKHRLDLAKGLGEALRAAIGPAESYAERKRLWRDQVGYTKLPMRITVRATAVEMARHLLGQVESVRAEIPHASETRFGITRQLAHLMQPASVRLGLTDGEPATFRVRREPEVEDVSGAFWTILRAFRSDDLPADARIWRFHGGLLQVLAKADGTVDLELSYESTRSAALHAWRSSAAAARLLFAGRCELSLGLNGERLRLGCSEVERPFPLDLSPVDVALQFAELVGFDESLELTGPGLIHWHEDRAEVLGFRPGGTSTVSFALSGEMREVLSKKGISFRVVQPVVARLGGSFAATYVSLDLGVAEVVPLNDGRISIDSSGATHSFSAWTRTEEIEAVHRSLSKLKTMLLSASRADLAIIGFGHSLSDLRKLVEEREAIG